MLHRPSVIAVTLIAVALAASVRGGGPTMTDADRLKASLTKWEKARDESGGDYSYQVAWRSAFGFGHTTTITVRGNKIEERKFAVFGRPEPVRPGEKPPEQKPKWVETGKEIGSHKEGAAARTVDELYAEALKVLNTNLSKDHQRSLGFDTQGFLNYCFIRDTRIADDAPLAGIRPFQLHLKSKK